MLEMESTLEFCSCSIEIRAFYRHMLRYPNPRTIFLAAIALLLSSAIATGWTIYRLYDSERWVHHTFEVELRLGAIESNLAKAGRSRSMFVNTGYSQFLQDYSDARDDAFQNLATVRSLTSDNAEQQERCKRLGMAMTGRLDAVQKGIDAAKAGITDRSAQADLTAGVVEWANQTAAIITEMNQSEETLLTQRNKISEKLFRLILSVLLATFVLSIFLIWEHYRRLAIELRIRTVEEERARNLSLQVLRAQDEERRRISRELHDGLGQSLVAAKIIADTFVMQHPNEPLLADLTEILDDSLSGARTLSYLLHPPLLDEIGLTSAAESFVAGYTKRTGIPVSFEVRGAKRRLRPVTELTLFRVLQESLTNVHRHAKASGAEVLMRFEVNQVGMRIHDHGVGISPEKLQDLREHDIDFGLGLSGMRHRVQEQNGTFQLSSNVTGTTIDVLLPVS
jgi:signal transduction histidine kinase